MSAAVCKLLSYNLDYLSDNTLSALTSNQLHFRYGVFPLPSAALKSKLYYCAIYMNILRCIMLDVPHTRRHLSFHGPQVLAKHAQSPLDLQTPQVTR